MRCGDSDHFGDMVKWWVRYFQVKGCVSSELAPGLGVAPRQRVLLLEGAVPPAPEGASGLGFRAASTGASAAGGKVPCLALRQSRLFKSGV